MCKMSLPVSYRVMHHLLALGSTRAKQRPSRLWGKEAKALASVAGFHRQRPSCFISLCSSSEVYGKL